MGERASFLDRHYFFFRRLHSLTGIVPIGVFLIMHLTTNSSVVWGEIAGGGVETFQHEVNFIHSLPALLLIEVFGLWLPIGFHAAFGVYYAMTGRPNVRRYGYQDNWRYTLQRVSGYVGIVFIFFHVATLRWGWSLPFSNAFDIKAASSSTAQALRGGPDGGVVGGIVVGAIYLAGITMLVFHFANGLWTAAITWGVTVTEKAQARWSWVCGAVGVAMLAMGWSAYVGFVTLDLEEARAVERGMIEAAPESPLDQTEESADAARANITGGRD